MNKTQLVDAVAAQTHIPKATAKAVVDTVLSVVIDKLCEGEEVRLAGFGIFRAPMKDACERRNPRTGEPVVVPARREPKFKFGAVPRTLIRES